MRIGIGIDTHALASGYKLVLGGVHIKHNCGLVGHSDADVLCHAIMDALLGAARIVGAHDIGELFPDTNPSYKGASSIELLAKVGAILCDNSMRVCDLDSVIIAQRPRLSIYREAMRTNIAAALGIQIGQVGLKATTTEHLGPEGREEGITAHCVALVESE
ncbi:MAG: 2-C-methyl-D-erythritol 2,4-cyclodiphosphate synthase [Coriobacteriales bacterium]|nr:2-C-methyl-D-erythritol 2,4-cyclodiphosphate synthase [Coriobacteriales bacterium]